MLVSEARSPAPRAISWKTGDGRANWEGRVVQIRKHLKLSILLFSSAHVVIRSSIWVAFNKHNIGPLNVTYTGGSIRQPGAELPAPRHHPCSRWSLPTCDWNGSTHRFVEPQFAVGEGTAQTLLKLQWHKLTSNVLYASVWTMAAKNTRNVSSYCEKSRRKGM